jgi:hypothetical protein
MNWKNCRKNSDASLYLNITNGTIDKLEMSGFFNVSKGLDGVELRIEASKCSLDLQTCDRYPIPPIKNFCEISKKEGVYFSNAFKMIEPNFECPLQVGTYIIKQNIIEFPSFFSYIPLGGYVWFLAFKLVDIESRNLKACFNAQIKFTSKRVRVKPTIVN